MALAVIGILLVIFGVGWMTAIFPQISKIPANLKQSTEQQGTVELFDSGTGQLQHYDVTNTRDYSTVKCSGNIIYIWEDITFKDATGQEISALHTKTLLAIDRVTRANVPGHGDGNRDGYWSFPRDVKADLVYPFWNTGNPSNLDCIYTGEDDLNGIHVYKFEMSTPEEGLVVPAGIDTPEMKVYQKITQWVEPVSGLTVRFESTTKRTTTIPVQDSLFPNTGPITYTDITLYEDNLEFTDATVEQMSHDARFYRWVLPFAETTVPWLSIGLGLVVIIGSAFLIRTASKKSQ
ncbi:MAG: porin PorA family protein [Chloroflexi bacterium]|nr:porin PorA family protein [Chloroflexota bacterium]